VSGKVPKIDLESLVLLKGSHSKREEGVCFLEAVSWFAGERHSDQPKCVSPVIANFGRRWNDDLDDAGRQRLKPYIPKLVGTKASKQVEEARGWMLADWMFRTHLPAWLDLAGITEPAAALRALPPIADLTTFDGSVASVREAGDRAAAARAAAWAAAWDAARDAAWAAARDAAWAAAWDAARDAAWAAARAAAWDAARDAARDAAWDAARDAARAAARDAASKGGDYTAQYKAAYDVTAAKLAPTKASLQDSAFELLDRLISAGGK
jgi:hypothetical protein